MATFDPAANEPNSWQALASQYQFQGRLVYAYGFYPHWRGVLARFIQGCRIHHTRRIRDIPDQAVVIVWGYKDLSGLGPGCQVVRLEDGFLRSVGLGAEFSRPLSWVVDFDHLYFDATGPSRLENLLNEHSFSTTERVRAQNLLESIQSAGLTKYNTGRGLWQRPPDKERVILVPGQVESDASIRHGSPQTRTNLALLRQVKEANPQAWVLYKPHPDVVAGARKAGESEGDAQHWCSEIVSDVGMGTLLGQVDEVHTMTSLTGFEALVRNIPVTCYGLPFYSGWGLTNDRLTCKRRRRRLELTELVHAVLIQYPLYVSRADGRYISPEQTLHELQQWRGMPGSWEYPLKKTARKLISLIRGKT